MEVHVVPSRGMASDTCGRVSVTMLWKTVSERRMVTPETTNRREDFEERKGRVEHVIKDDQRMTLQNGGINRGSCDRSLPEISCWGCGRLGCIF